MTKNQRSQTNSGSAPDLVLIEYIILIDDVSMSSCPSRVRVARSRDLEYPGVFSHSGRKWRIMSRYHMTCHYVITQFDKRQTRHAPEDMAP